MNKNIVAGLSAAGLIISGGTGLYVAHAKENTTHSAVYMNQQGIGTSQMTQMMNSTNIEEMQKFMQSKNLTFDQLLPYMKKIHPGLSDEQLKALYEQMHGTNGSPSCANVQGMMGNTSGNKE